MDRRKDTAIEAILEQLIEHGSGDIAGVFARAFELAMRIERERFQSRGDRGPAGVATLNEQNVFEPGGRLAGKAFRIGCDCDHDAVCACFKQMLHRVAQHRLAAPADILLGDRLPGTCAGACGYDNRGEAGGWCGGWHGAERATRLREARQSTIWRVSP